MLLNAKFKQSLEEVDALGGTNPFMVLLYLFAVASAAAILFGFR